MEGFTPENKREKENAEFNRHIGFFSVNSIEKKWANFIMILGSIYVCAGIYECLTGEKISSLIDEYKDQIPNMINQIIDHWDSTPASFKAAIGSSMSGSGVTLKRLLDEKDDSEK
jgi:hypothetical protein